MGGARVGVTCGAGSERGTEVGAGLQAVRLTRRNPSEINTHIVE